MGDGLRRRGGDGRAVEGEDRLGRGRRWSAGCDANPAKDHALYKARVEARSRDTDRCALRSSVERFEFGERNWRESSCVNVRARMISRARGIHRSGTMRVRYSEFYSRE